MNLTWRVGLYCLVGGLFFTASALRAGHFWLWWLSGVITVASLAPVVRFGPRSWWALFGSVALAMVVVGLVCTLSEGVLFFPQMKNEVVRDLAGGTVAYLIVAALLAALAKLLRLAKTPGEVVEHRAVGIAIPMVLLAGLSYVLYYQVFGVIAFDLYTKQFYPQAVAIVGKLGAWFWVYQWARGTLMVLAVLPVIYTLRLPRRQAALAVGVLVWIVGGGAALLVPNAAMVPAQRYAHILEIMTQNVSLGVTAVWLLRRKGATAVAPHATAAAA
ncbi:MAG TPA: hypothetical protein VMD29_17275 [Terracidiphilus sp.]|nr:hypothetical protein [Terracidiphilus sp.]